jgi:hypothetical protein
MAFATVTTTVMRPDDTPHPGAILSFSIAKGSYTVDAQYPKSGIHYTANQLGQIVAILWVDGTGLVDTHWWVCYQNGEKKRFSIPAGTTSATLESLFIGSTPLPPIGDPSERNLAALLQLHNNDPGAHGGLGGGGGVVRFSPVASSNISALRVLTVDINGQAIYADAANITHANKVLGISKQSIIQGQSVPIYDNEVVTDNAWTWTPDLPIFLGLNGVMTQTPPSLPTSLFSLRIGVALSPTIAEIEVQEPLILTSE